MQVEFIRLVHKMEEEKRRGRDNIKKKLIRLKPKRVLVSVFILLAGIFGAMLSWLAQNQLLLVLGLSLAGIGGVGMIIWSIGVPTLPKNGCVSLTEEWKCNKGVDIGSYEWRCVSRCADYLPSKSKREELLFPDRIFAWLFSRNADARFFSILFLPVSVWFLVMAIWGLMIGIVAPIIVIGFAVFGVNLTVLWLLSKGTYRSNLITCLHYDLTTKRCKVYDSGLVRYLPGCSFLNGCAHYEAPTS